jgi:hypothetical protein
VDIGKALHALEMRVAKVERQARLSHAALDNTNIVVRDGTGAVRGRIGMQADGTIGLIAQDGPAPGAPTAPVVTPSIGGLRVVWDGALADGSLLPADFDHIAVHISTTTGFTPSAATFVGTITRSGDGGMLPVTPLPYDDHYTVLTAVNSSGIAGPASAETAATPLQVEGPDLTAGSVTAGHIAAGAVTAEKLEAILQIVTRLVAGDPDGARVELNEDGLRVYNAADVLMVRFDAATGDAVFTGEVTGSAITGGTITGSVIQTAASGERVTINEAAGNKVLVYDDTGRVVAELSGLGLALEGTNGSLLILDPDATFPNFRLTNAAKTNEAVINVSENTAGAADLGLNSGEFSGSGFTDMKWRTFFGNDFWVAERVRDSAPSTVVGGRMYLSGTGATVSYMNTTDAVADTQLVVSSGQVGTLAGRLSVQSAAGETNSMLFLQPGASHTGHIVRYWDPDASVYRFSLDKSGNTTVGGKLSAGNIASGRVQITPVANTPTSATVTGLNLQGTVRVVATPQTALPYTEVRGVSVNNVTATGFNIWLTRTNTSGTGVDWIVIAEP